MSDTNQPEEVDIYTCRECNSTNLTPDITGVVFCDDCGL
jgi:ribosomal protein L37AE/L43A